MSSYFWFCIAMFALGVFLLGIGTLLREKIPPRTASMLILCGAVIAMIFMNLCLFMYMQVSVR